MIKYEIIYSESSGRFEQLLQEAIDRIGYSNIKDLKITHREYEHRDYDYSYAEINEYHYADIIWYDSSSYDPNKKLPGTGGLGN